MSECDSKGQRTTLQQDLEDFSNNEIVTDVIHCSGSPKNLNDDGEEDKQISDEEKESSKQLCDQPTATADTDTNGHTHTAVLPIQDTLVNELSNNRTSGALPPAAMAKKKELMRPLFSRSSTADKVAKANASKSMIVETETVDASNVPSVTLPIASNNPNELMSNTSSLSNNLASLRSKKSTIFVDQNNTQVIPQVNPGNTNSADDNDNASITGSIRNFNKRLNLAESHLNITKPGATKADLFAAKIANAVGDNSESDSEETFVYESAPDVLNSTNTIPLNKTVSGIAASNNPMSLRKLSQRNISMPVTSQNYSPSMGSHIVLTNDESKEQNNQIYETEEESDGGIKIGEDANADEINSTINPGRTDDVDNQEYSTVIKSSLETAKPPVTGKPLVFTKYNGSDTSRKPSTTSLQLGKKSAGAHPTQLRTTTSKLFDVKGSTLRRYSGVPDDVNIEDYIDQYDEERDIGDGSGGGDYGEPYDYNDYEDDELTPLDINKANHNLKNKMTRHYHNRRSVTGNFGSTNNRTDEFYDLNLNTDENRHTKPKRYKSRTSQQQHSPHNFYNKKKSSRFQAFKNFMYFFILVFFLVALGFAAGFLLATSKELQEVKIASIDDILVSYEELVFDLSVSAYNPGFVSIEVSQVELDIFAKSSFAESSVFPIFGDPPKAETETILLGSVSEFETPLVFASGFFNRNHSQSKGEIKLLHPGQNSTSSDDGRDENHKTENDSDKWKNIIKHPFDLIVRGSLKYNIPFFHTERSVPITKVVTITPDDGLSVK